MSTIQEKLNEMQSKADAANEKTVPIVYQALRAGRYSLDNQLELPNELGQFIEEGSEQRIADLQAYEARGLVIKLPTE